MHSKPLKLEEIQHSNEMNSHTFERLSRVYKLLLNSTNLPQMINECDNLYELEESSLLEDLMRYPGINQDMIRYLHNGYDKSQPLRQMIHSDIYKLLNMNKTDTVLEIFYRMNHNNILHKTVFDSILYIKNNKESLEIEKIKALLANLLIHQTLLSGDYILSSSFALHFKNQGINITESTLKLMLHTLALNEFANSYNSYIIFKIIEEFNIDDNLKLNEKMQLLVYLSSDKSSPFYANLFYEKYFSKEEKAKLFSIEEFRNDIINFIRINFDFGNYRKSQTLWIQLNHALLCQNKSYIQITKRILQRIINSNDSSIEKIICVLPEVVLKTQEVSDLMLVYYGKEANKNDKFNLELKNLSPPLRRLTLSLLFEAFLLQNNEKAAEKILQSIFNSTNGINEKEFNIIVQKLLNQDNIEEAINMVKKSESNISRLACINIISKLLSMSNTKKNTNRITEVLAEIRKNNNGLHHEYLTEIILSHLSTRVSNRACRGLFTKILRFSLNNNVNFERQLHMEKYGLPNELRFFLKINEKNHISCLRIILEQAILDEDETTLLWVIDEMRFAGMLLDHILLELPHTDFVSRVIKSDYRT